MVHAIAYGLISTIHNHKVLHGITILKLTKDCNHLHKKVSKLAINLKDKRDNIKMPEGFKLNAGCVNAQVLLVVDIEMPNGSDVVMMDEST